MSGPSRGELPDTIFSGDARAARPGADADPHSEAIWRRLEPVIARFEAAFWRGERPDIAAFLPADEVDHATLIPELVHAEIELRLKAGEPVKIDDYLRRYPSLADHPSLARQRETCPETLPIDGEGTDPAVAPPEHVGPRSSGRMVGRYRLEQEIGRGGFGVVYRALDTELGRAVAVKLVRHGRLATPAEAERLVREARSSAGLKHPNIVPVYDAGVWEDEPYLVTALVEGPNLAEEIAAHQPGYRQSAEWVAALADALEHAHRSGIIHRDVKPSNVLLDRDLRVHLTDFGLAKSDSAAALSITVKGEIAGTPAYMAPEQARSERPHADARTDTYSLGVILYELLSGTRPFVGAGQRLLERILEEDPPPPRRLDSAVPADLETVCLKAMAKEPQDRYASAAAFADDLRRWLAGEPVLARPESSIAALWRKCRRKPFLFGLVAALILAVVVGFAGVAWALGRSEAQRRRAEASLELAQTQRQRAVRALVQVNQTLTTLASLTDERLVGKASPGRETLWKTLLEHSQTFAEQVRDDPAFLSELAHFSLQIATLRDFSGSLESAIPAWEQARRYYEKLLEREPTNLDCRIGLSACLTTVSYRFRHSGRKHDSHDLARRSREICMGALEIVKQKREAAPGDRAALAAEIFWNYRLAECESLLGQPATAITILRRANEMAGELARAMPANAESHRLAGKGCTELARLLRTSSPGEARALAQRACEECETAVRVEPTEVIMSLDLLGNAISLLASVEDQVGQTEEALRDFRRAAEIDERLYRERPFDRRCWERLAMTQHCIARILTELGRPAEALEPFRKAIERREALVRLSPEDVKWRSDLNGSWMRLGEALEALGRTTEAVAAHRAAVACQRQVCAREPDEIAHKKCLDDQLRHLAWLLLSLGRRVEVVEIACERVGRQGHDPAVIFSAAGELAMAALLVRCEERAFLSLLGGQRATCAALALSAAHHATLLAGRRFPGQ